MSRNLHDRVIRVGLTVAGVNLLVILIVWNLGIHVILRVVVDINAFDVEGGGPHNLQLGRCKLAHGIFLMGFALGNL